MNIHFAAKTSIVLELHSLQTSASRIMSDYHTGKHKGTGFSGINGDLGVFRSQIMLHEPYSRYNPPNHFAVDPTLVSNFVTIPGNYYYQYTGGYNSWAINHHYFFPLIY